MSRINSNLIYIWNAFRNLNAIKADKEVSPEVTPEVPPSDEVELGAANTSWSDVGCQTLSGGYHKIQDDKYCFSFASRATVDDTWRFQTDVKHNNETIRQLSFNFDWLKKNKTPTFYVEDLHKYRLWIEWPVWKGKPGVSDQDIKDLEGVKVLIRAYDANPPDKNTGSRTAEYKKNQYWTHDFFQ
jgi:hypothetical protein|tara:strand:- start:152 stop:706 length:555 start_codon:yes stop_codon:yes gene_type:complete